MSKALKVIKSIAVTDSVLTATSVAESDYPVWSSGTTYAAGGRVILTSTHKIYQSLQAGNIGKDPTSEPLWWVEVSYTNRWKLFDLSSTTQTVIDSSDYYELKPNQAVNAVGLVNISGILSIRIRLTDPDFGVVYDKIADITAVPKESSWYAWFFEPRTMLKTFVASDLPSYPNATLRIDVTSSGMAYIGSLVFGTQRNIGMGVKQGIRLGIQDYSRKERNDWGDTVLVQRAFARRASINMLIENSDLDNIYTTLSDLRSTPCLWVVNDSFESLNIFGFFNNFEINISYARYSDVSIDIEGLT